MNKLEELRRRQEQIRREKEARQELSPASDTIAPLTAAASARQPPAPPLMPVQAEELMKEIEALRAELKGQQVESARANSRVDELEQQLIETSAQTDGRLAQVETNQEELHADTRASLRLIAERQAELSTRLSSHALPLAATETARNVTPRLMPKGETLPAQTKRWSELPPPLPPRLRPTPIEPPTYQAARPQSVSRPSAGGQSSRAESSEPLPTWLKVIYGVIAALLLAAVICLAALVVSWMLANPWTTVAISALIIIVLLWLGASWLTWQMEMKAVSAMIIMIGLMLMLFAGIGYETYREWTAPSPIDVEQLGR